jgi:GTP pyrophosphokinase
MQDSIPVAHLIERDIAEARNSFWVHIRKSQDIEEDERFTVLQALKLAWSIHDGQQRDEGTSYIIHPIRVATAYVQRWQENQKVGAITALLHDVLEEGNITKDDIKNRFTSEIAEAVSALTKNKELPESEMRQRYLD